MMDTRFICIIYPRKHNGTVLLMYETCSKQLERKQILDQTTTVILGAPKVNECLNLKLNTKANNKIILY